MEHGNIVSNSNYNVTNRIHGDEYVEVLNDTLDIIIEQLKDVCGPYARDVLAYTANHVDAMKHDGNRWFMHDGRLTIDFLQFSAPIQESIKKAVEYIGSRIDSCSHDGTTSSMLFACYFLKELLNYRDSFKSYTIGEIDTFIKDVMSTLHTLVKDSSLFDVDKLSAYLDDGCSKNELAAVMAFIQAYTSSGRNLEIATAMRDYYLNTHELAWTDSIYSKRPCTESSKVEVKCVKFDHEATFDIVVNDFSRLANSHNKQLYVNDKIDLLLVTTQMTDAGMMATDLLNYIDNNEDRPLLVMLPNTNLNISTGGILYELYNRVEDKKPLIIVSYNLDRATMQNKYNKVSSIIGKANKKEFDSSTYVTDCIIPEVKVKMSVNYIEIDNITPKDDRVDPKSNLHPGVTYPEDYPEYTAMVNDLKDVIDFYSKSYVDNSSLVEHMKEALSDMYIIHRSSIEYSGTKHDVEVLIPIIEDASGAAMDAVKNGFYFNIFEKLHYLTYTPAVIERYEESKASHILDVIREALRNVIGSVYRVESFGVTLGDEVFHSDMTIAGNNLLDEGVLGGELRLDLLDSSIFKAILKYKDMEELVGSEIEYKLQRLFPTQSATMPSELFRRTNEVMTRFFTTNSVLIKGTAWRSQ